MANAQRTHRDPVFGGFTSRSRRQMYMAIFLLFTPIWAVPLASIVEPGKLFGFIAWSLLSGTTAVLWVASFSRSMRLLPLAIGSTLLISVGGAASEMAADRWGFPLSPGIGIPVPTAEGVFMLLCLIAGYVLFVMFIDGEGRRQLRLRTEMDLAAKIHASLVPDIAIDTPQAEVFGRSIASSEMGGDLIDVIARDGRLDVYLGDVSGHGVRAGVIMGAVKSALRTATLEGRQDIGSVMGTLNRVVGDLTEPDMFATFAALRLEGGRVWCAMAGHPPVFIVSSDGEVRSIDSESLPIGIIDAETFESREIECQPGDLVVIYTDGLTETADAQGRMLGIDGLRELVKQHASGSLAGVYDAIMGAIEAHGEQNDDRTLLLVRVR